MAANNPPYQAMLDQILRHIDAWTVPAGSTLVDLGAGTGNLSIRLAQRFPDARVLHVEPDPAMNACVPKKAELAGVTNLELCPLDVGDRALGERVRHADVSGIAVVHALYAFPDPERTLTSVATWLRDGTPLLVCDPFGPPDVLRWAAYLFRTSMQRRGVVRTLQLYVRGRAALSQNRRIARGYREGRHWAHSQDELLGALRRAGLRATVSESVYRGDSHLVVAHKQSKPLSD